ncbi:MAG TPA: hypothetical protein VHZ03_16655 [Trebonia sp.]|nr:hypothetical protein [Trebonia sp.]
MNRYPLLTYRPPPHPLPTVPALVSSVAPNNDDLVTAALVCDPYGAVLARTASWAVGMLAALGVMVVCWGRIRRAQRAALLPGPLALHRPRADP